MAKRALVAGGAGFIGSHLCESLVHQGYEVTIVDNLSTGRLSNVSHLLGNGVKFIEADICEPFEVPECFDEIYHLASPASPKDFARMGLAIFRANTQGNDRLLTLAAEMNARYLFASSSEIYGESNIHPQNEDYRGNVRLTGVRASYTEGKRAGEVLCSIYRHKHNLKVRVPRIFNVYGPRMRSDDGRVVPTFIDQALRHQPLTVFGDGSQTRSLCYVSDMIEALQLLMQSDYDAPVNLGNPEEISVLNLAQRILSLTKSTSSITYLPLPEGDPPQRSPDISLAKRTLNWKPKTTLEQGLKECLRVVVDSHL